MIFKDILKANKISEKLLYYFRAIFSKDEFTLINLIGDFNCMQMDVRTNLNTIIFREKTFNMNGKLIHYLRRMNLRKLRVLIL